MVLLERRQGRSYDKKNVQKEKKVAAVTLIRRQQKQEKKFRNDHISVPIELD